MSEIFISYRRDDSSGFAGALLRELNDEFGDERIFMDVDDIKGGVDYAGMIREELEGCEILVAIIGKHWLTLADSEGRRRLDDPEDMVRIEVATALAKGKVVVPVLVKGAPMPTRADLPEDLQGLAMRNAIEIANTNWEGDVAELNDVLYEHLSAAPGVQTKRAVEERAMRRAFLGLLVVPWLVAALALAPLALMRTSAEVEIRLTVDRLSFRVGERGAEGFLSAIPTESLTVQAFEWVDLGTGNLRVAVFDSQGRPESWGPIERDAYRLKAVEPAWSNVTFDSGETETSPAAEIMLNQLDLTPGTLVTLSWDRETPNDLQVRAVGQQASGRIGVPPNLGLRCDSCRLIPPNETDEESLEATLSSDDHREIGFLGAGEGSTLSLQLPPNTPIVKQDIAVAGDLRFLSGTLPDVTSSVIGDGGTVVLVELDREIPVREGEFLVVGDDDRLLLRTLELESGLALTLHGRVDSLSSGSAGFGKSRLPSRLGWLYARAGWLFYLLFGGLIGTTVLAFLRRSRSIGARR